MSPSKSSSTTNHLTTTDTLGVVPSQKLLKDLEKYSEAKQFLEEYNNLLTDDCNEYERLLTLVGPTSSSTNNKKNNQNNNNGVNIPLAQYMIVPLSLVRLCCDKKNDDESLMKFLSTKDDNDDKLEEKFSKLFGKSSKNYSATTLSTPFQPLQIVFRSPLPTTTFEQRRVQREKFRVARAHQEREAYNRMLRGNYENSSSNTLISSNLNKGGDSTQTVTERLIENVLFKKQIDAKKDPIGASSSMRLKASAGGAGFLARDAFSSSSRQEMEHITGMSSKSADEEAAANGGDNIIKKISRDVGLGLDVPLMALAGAVVGWYACSLRGMSSNESAIGAAVCATIMLIVDGGLILMKLAREDLKSTKEKKRRDDELQKAIKASMGTTMGNAAEKKQIMDAENERKKKNYRVISREVLGEVPFDQEDTKEVVESKKDK